VDEGKDSVMSLSSYQGGGELESLSVCNSRSVCLDLQELVSHEDVVGSQLSRFTSCVCACMSVCVPMHICMYVLLWLRCCRESVLEAHVLDVYVSVCMCILGGALTDNFLVLAHFQLHTHIHIHMHGNI
jgi:hypothetical protein